MRHTRRAGRTGGGREAFTMIELLVVVSIIIVLLVILVPTVRRALGYARDLQCANNLRQIGTAISTYMARYNEYIPFGGGTDAGNLSPFECIPECITNPELVLCPVDPTQGRNYRWMDLEHPRLQRCSYTWSEECTTFPLKTIHVKVPNTLPLIMDGTAATNRDPEGRGGSWSMVKPHFERKDREAASQWVHHGHYLYCLFADPHVDKVAIEELDSQRTDPRLLPAGDEGK